MSDDLVPDLSPMDGDLEEKDVSQIHEMKQTNSFDIFIPGHEPRTESATFRNTKKTLADAICWICGTKDSIEIHHFKSEWALINAADWTTLRALYPDFPDWAKIKDNDPTTYEFFVDSVYNCMPLCEGHHRSTGKDGKLGIHASPYPVWSFQKIVQSNYTYIKPQEESKELPTPQDFISDLQKRIRPLQDKFTNWVQKFFPK